MVACPLSYRWETAKDQCPKILRSIKIDFWECLNIQKVKVELFSKDKTVAFVEFDGKDSTYMNWFHNNRVLKSSWPDMRKGGQFNIFSLNKEARYGRHFFINKSYPRNGCPGDSGWFVVMDAPGSKPCRWEKQNSYPQFLYSKDEKVTKWQNMRYGRAEVLNIYIKRA
ncbi:uncharacterized protein LOC134280468 [Saccostrea cucullata]|uniref:uncharacterized protein LOC134280468 n=1 Tax=Saccostrea cuccullata TaxID=36930 RepID=UPI002ED2DE8A